MAKIILLVLFAISATVLNVKANIFDDIKSGINGALDSVRDAVCVVQHSPEFQDCYNNIKSVYQSMQGNSLQKDEIKEACCSYLAYKDCVEGVSYKYCGQEAARISEGIMAATKSVFTPQCEDYQTVFQCMDTVMLIGVIAVLAIVGIAILVCLVRICQSCCRC